MATRVVRRPTNTRGVQSVDPEETNVLQWDADNLRITNHPAANLLLTKVYRPGWEVPAA